MYTLEQLQFLIWSTITQKFDGEKFDASRFWPKPEEKKQENEQLASNLSPEQKKQAAEVQLQITILESRLQWEQAWEKINKAGAEKIEWALDESDKQDPDAKPTLEKLAMYKKRLSEATSAQGDIWQEIAILKSDLWEYNWKLKEDGEATKNFEINPEILQKFQDYVSQREKQAELPKGSISTMLSSKYNYSWVIDGQQEKEIAEAFLSNTENFAEEINQLIAEYKRNAEFAKSSKLLDGDTDIAELMTLQQDGWANLVDHTERIIQRKNPDIPPNTLMGKVLVFLKNLFWIEANSDRFNSYQWGRDAVNNITVPGGDINRLGSLSEFFESGERWPMAINGNDVWKPSFWTYQLRADHLKAFAEDNGIIGDHNETFTKWSESEFAKNWIAKIEEIGAKKFKELEHNYIKETHYDPAVTKAGFDVSKASIVLKNVIWSSAVQHWAATDVIRNAVQKTPGFTPGDKNSELQLIKNIYELRAEKKNATMDRYKKEFKLAVLQLKSQGILPSGSIRSIQKEVVRNPDGSVKMTYCARTARLNAAKLWVKVPQLESARALEDHFSWQGRLSRSEPTGTVFQAFSRSKRFPQYGHVATGFVRNGQAYILDPYLPVVGWKYSHNPIPFNQYKSYLASVGRKYNGVVNH